MTKQHFEALAEVFRTHRESAELREQAFEISGEQATGEILANGHLSRLIADVCATFGPNFDRERFLRACRGQS